MRGWWRRRLDPMHPYHAERAQGSEFWWAAAVACYSAAWQLLVLSAALALLVTRWTDLQSVAWWLLFSPSLAAAVAGAWCALSDHLDEDPFRWYSLWTVVAPALPALAYAFGPRRPGSART